MHNNKSVCWQLVTAACNSGSQRRRQIAARKGSASSREPCAPEVVPAASPTSSSTSSQRQVRQQVRLQFQLQVQLQQQSGGQSAVQSGTQSGVQPEVLSEEQLQARGGPDFCAGFAKSTEHIERARNHWLFWQFSVVFGEIMPNFWQLFGNFLQNVVACGKKLQIFGKAGAEAEKSPKHHLARCWIY